MLTTSDEDTISSKHVIHASFSYETPRSPHSRPNQQTVRRPLVYVTRRIPQAGLDVLLKVCNVRQWDSELVVTKGELLVSVVGVDGILCMPSDVINAEVLDTAGPQLRVVATLSYDSKHVAVGECHARGIQVVTCPFRPTEILAELTISLVLLTIKESQTEDERLSVFELQPPDLISSGPDGLPGMTKSSPLFLKRVMEEQLAFQWVSGKPGNTDCLTWRNIARMTFGVYGRTKLGLNIAKILKDIGIFNVLISDEDAEQNITSADISQDDSKFVSVDQLLRNSDVICVCGSAGEHSQELFSRVSFQKMKKQAILIVSQSQERAVRYTDLYAALRDGQIKAAGLNDCNQTPVPYKPLFMGLKNCTFLPQSQENVYDVRQTVSVNISKSLTDALILKGNQQTNN